MRLPGLARARVAPSKISRYLLASDHPTGQFKAEWLMRLGFRPEDPATLTASILAHAGDHEVGSVTRSPFGTSYVVEGTLRTPSGMRPRVRSVWFVGPDDEAPALVTLYPVRRSR